MLSAGEADDDFNFGPLEDEKEVNTRGGSVTSENSFTFDFNEPQEPLREENPLEEYDWSSLNFHELPRVPVEMLPPTPMPGAIPTRDSSTHAPFGLSSPRNAERKTLAQCLAAALEGGNHDQRSISSLSTPSARIGSQQDAAAGKRPSYGALLTGKAASSVKETNDSPSAVSPFSSATSSETEGSEPYHRPFHENNGFSFGEQHSTLAHPPGQGGEWRRNESSLSSSPAVDKWKPTRKPRCTFTHGEVKTFYDALSKFGTDFNLIALLFPKRDRSELKKLYHRELKKNQPHILAALNERRHFDEVELHQRIQERQKAMAAEPLRVLEKEEEAYLREIQEEMSPKNEVNPPAADQDPAKIDAPLNSTAQNTIEALPIENEVNWEDEDLLVESEPSEWMIRNSRDNMEEDRFKLSHKRSRSDELIVDLMPSVPRSDPL